MKTVAVIPVKGRLPLLKYTIQRLYRKNGVDKVICVGDTAEEKLCCEYNGAEFVQHPNEPLGKKWNKGFLAAKRHDPDAVLFVGSSDWISDNWIPFMAPFIMEQGIDLIGKPDFYMLDISAAKGLRFCHWEGYGKGPRQQEPIGIGRILSKRILDLMDWKPIQDELNNSIDWSMYHRVLSLDGKCMNLKTDNIQSLSISTDRWPNKHKFEDHYRNKLPSNRIPGFERWMDQKFLEYKSIFADEKD